MRPEKTLSTFVASCWPIDPALVSVLAVMFHTASGSAAIEVAIDVSDDPSDDDAAVTTVFVFVLTADAMPPVAESVCPFTTAAIELDAVVSVPESVLICESVWPLTVDAILPVALSV